MAVKFRTTTQGFTNFWTQLKDIASTKSLYNAADYEALTSSQKEQYLSMLYANNDALAQRMPEEYNNEYGDTQTRFALLSAVNAKYTAEKNASNPEYAQQLTDAVNKQLDAQLSSDIDKDKNWVDWLVKNRYNGSYASFAADYSGDNAKKYEDALTEMVPAEYELNEQSFKEGVSNVVDTQNAIRLEHETAQSEAYKNTLKYVKEKINANAEKEAYENASTLTKILNTTWQIPTLWAAELVEIVEGVGDALLTVGAAVEEIFSDTSVIRGAIEYDWWTPETWLGVATSESYLNKYADENIASWIYEIGINIVDMAPLAIPGIGQAVYYASAFGKSIESNLQSDYAFGESFASAIGSTAIEMGTEKLSGSKFFGGGVFKKWEKIGGKNLGWKIFHDSFGEGLEEVISGIGSDLWHGMITGDYTLDTSEGWAQIGKSFMIGGLVGGIMTAGNAGLESHVASKTAVRLKNADGKIINLPLAKAAVISDFVQRTGKKIEAGKTVSNRTRERFDILKNMKVVETDMAEQVIKAVEKSAKGKDIRSEDLLPTEARVKLVENYYAENVQPKISRKLRLEELVKEAMHNKKTSDTTSSKPDKKLSFAEEAEKLRKASEKPATDNSTYEFTEENGPIKDFAAFMHEMLDKEDLDRLQKDFQISGAMTLGKLVKMFGEDALTSGIKLWAQYQDKTISEVIELLQLGSEDSAFTVVTDADNKTLSQHFSGAEFVTVDVKVGTEVSDKYKAVTETLKATKSALRNITKPQIKLFLTTGETVATSFFVDNVMYINAAWLAETDVGRIKDIIIAKHCVQDAMITLDTVDEYQSTRQLLMEAIRKIDNPNRSTDIMLQEMAFIMFFQKDNILLRQVLSYSPDKTKAVIEYFSALRQNYASRHVQNAAGAILSNMVLAAEDIFDTGEEPDPGKTLPEDKTESVKDIIDAYKEHEFRAFPFITGKNGIPRNTAKVQAMYLYMQKTYGFNAKLNLNKKINWIKQLTNPKNYDGDGFKRLTEELNKYRDVPSSTGYIHSTVAINKTLGELLNYYLDNICGLMVFPNGTITESEFTTEVLNIDALESYGPTWVGEDFASREPIGKVGDFISKERCPADIQDIPIYLTFNSNGKARASMHGTPKLGMFMTVNIPNIKALLSERITIGGKRLVLDTNGELITKSDGSFEIQDYTREVSRLTYVVGHEIGHAICMAMNFAGTFSDTDIAKTYIKLFEKTPKENRRAIVDSIKNWLLDDGKVKSAMRPFAYYLGVNANDIINYPDKADAEIIAFVETIETAVDKFSSRNEKQVSAFENLSTYLYSTGFAHEMFADAKAESVARTDSIRSTLTEDGLTLIAESDLYFINVLNGTPVKYTRTVEQLLAAVQDTPENAARRIFDSMDSVQNLMQELGVEVESDLIDPNFWRAKLNKPIKTTRSDLITGFEEQFSATYNSVSKEFEPGFVSHSIRDTYSNIPKPGENFSAMILGDGKVVNTKNHTAYNNGSKIKGFIAYQPRKRSLVVNISEGIRFAFDKNRNVIILDKCQLPIQPHTAITLIAGGKVFRSVTAAKSYINTKPVFSENSDFEALFERILEQAETVGRQYNYINDTIYMTADGKIYNIDVNMADWYGYAENVFKNKPEKIENLLGQYSTDDTGSFITDNEEGISYNLSRLLDDKKVIRLYRNGETWVAYGTPNKLQEYFVTELRAEHKYEPLYVTNIADVKSNLRLFLNLEGNKPVVAIKPSNWKEKGFREIDWKRYKWYIPLCNILQKYDITTLQDLELLGFSQDFIDAIATGKNMPEQFFLDYIRDGSNTDYSKNILIENCPDPNKNADREFGDWKNNPHLHSIEDAREYWNLVTTYVEIMPEDKIFDSVFDLKVAMEKAKNDPANIDAIESSMKQAEEYLKAFSDELYIQLLNKDYSTGLGLDKNSFANAIGYIGQSYKNALRTGRYKQEVGFEIEDDEGHTKERTSYTELDFENVDGNALDEVTTDLNAYIEEIKTESDVAVRNQRLQELLDDLRLSPMYKSYEYKDEMRNKILNLIEGVDLELAYRTELDRLKERIENFKKLETDTPEQLKERRQLIRLYERTKNTKIDKLLNGGKTYYNRYLALLREVGTYNVVMAAEFTALFKKADRLKEKVQNSDNFEQQLDKVRELRANLKLVDMEYPGWYRINDSLLQMTKDWLNGKRETQGKTFAAVRTDIINFINKYESDSEFRSKIAAREGKSDYIFTKQVRGAQLTQSDLERFKNIPEDFKDISEFPEEAKGLYEAAKNNIDALADMLTDPESITTLLKLYGQDFIYNLQQLYNDSVSPVISLAISESKKDALLLTNIMKKAGFSKEATNIVADKAQTYENVKSAADKIRQSDYLDYSKYAVTRAKGLKAFLAAGRPISDADRKKSVLKIADIIKNYRWKKNQWRTMFLIADGPDREFFDSPDSKQYKESQVAKYHEAKQKYLEAHRAYNEAQYLINKLKGDDWLEHLPNYLDNKTELATSVKQYNYEQKRYLTDTAWRAEQLKKHNDEIKDLNERLEYAKKELAKHQAALGALNDDSKIARTEYTKKEISRLEEFFKKEYDKYKASNKDYDATTIYNAVHAENKGRWATLNLLRENLHKLAEESPDRKRIKTNIRVVTDEISSLTKDIAKVEFMISELPEITPPTVQVPKDAEKMRDTLIADRERNLPSLKKAYDSIKEVYDTLEAEYEAAKAKYYGETAKYETHFDEVTGTYKSVKTTNTKLESDKLRYKILQESDVKNILSLLKGEKIEVVRDGNKVSISVNTGAPARIKRIANIINQYFGRTIETTNKLVPTEVSLKSLTRRQKYRILTALNIAYFNFMDDPKTDRARDRFEADAMLALQSGKINATVRGDTKKHLLSIHVPSKYITPIEQGGSEIKEQHINDKLKHFNNGDLLEQSKLDKEQIKKLQFFEEAIDLKDQTIEDMINATITEGEKLRQLRIRRDRHDAKFKRATVVERARVYEDEIIFDLANTAKFIGPTFDSKGYPTGYLGEVNISDESYNRIPRVEFYKYMSYKVEQGLKEGWLKYDEETDRILDSQTNGVVIYNYEDLVSGTFDEVPEDTDFIESSGESNLLDDDFTFEPLVIDTPRRAQKGTYDAIDYKSTESLMSGLSSNTAKILQYKPSNWNSEKTFNSADFLADNAEYIDTFLSSPADMETFVSKIENGVAIPLGSPQEYVIFALLNKISNLAQVTINNTELANRAEVLVKQLAARAGATLGMIKSYGTTSVDQLTSICSKLINLSDEEKQLLADCATVQQNAIAAGNYTRASEAFDEVLKVLKKHQDELPVSMNIFAKELTPEERTTRWHNIAERVTSWRYFAMLGAPTTFFAKNLASNVIITGMDNAAEAIGNAIVKKTGNTRFETNYAFVDTVIEQVLSTGKILKLLSVAEVRAIVEQTITDQADRKHVDINKLTKTLNDFITTRYKVQKTMPAASQVTTKANEWLRKQFYQYTMDKKPSDRAKRLMELKLVKNGLLSGLMDDSVSKYDRGYDIKIGKLREIVLNKDTTLDEISEADAAILADALRSDSPFGSNPNNLLNKYYRFIFRSMEWGDKKFIEPKIKKTVAALIESNMTEAEMTALENGDKAALAKFNEFVQYAVDDAMKTYFRSNSDFQKKVMRLFNGHPVAQLIFGTLMPFPRMALNTMSTVLSYSPVGFIKALIMSHNNQDAFSQLKVSKELGKAVTGSVALAVGAALAACGWLDFDDDDEYAGVQLIIGNKIRLALDDLMPSAMPLVIGATMTNHWTEGIWSVVYNGGDVLLDSTLLGEAIEIFGGNKQSTDVVIDTFSSFVNQFMPAVFRHTARAVDPTSKKYSSNKGIKIMQRLAASLPAASYLVPAKIDPYTGESVYQNIGHDKGWIDEGKFHFGWANVLSFINAFAPTKITLDVGSDVENESKTVGAPTTGPSKTYTIDGVEYTIPEELYKDYQILRAKLYSQYAQSTINTSRYQNMSIEQKRAKLRRLQTKATQEARKQLKIGK